VSSWRRLVVVLIALALAPLTVLLTAGPSAADPTAHITGHVTGTAGVDLGSIEVTAYVEDGGAWNYVTSTYTGADGLYDLSDLEPGTYRIGFHDCSCSGYLDEYWNDQATVEDATDILVGDGETVDGIDAGLMEAGHIAGTVTGLGGAPLENIYVEVTRRESDDTWVYAGQAGTASDGTYRINGLVAGDYRVQFQDAGGTGYLSEYFDDATDPVDAHAVAVTLQQGTTVDAQLALGGSVTGTVTDGTDPLEGMKVYAFSYSSVNESWGIDLGATTDADGHYTIVGLSPGTDYRIEFLDLSGARLSEFYPGAESLEAADDISITDSTPVTGIDGVLVPGGHLTGVVEDEETGAGLGSVNVDAYREDIDTGAWDYAGGTATNGAGAFDLGGLRTGSYQLRFDSSTDSHVREWWDDVADQAGAAAVSVTAGTSTALPHDVLLEPLGSITGTARDDQGDPVSGVQVQVLAHDGDTWAPVRYQTTDTDGAYSFVGLRAGTYRLGFFDTGGGYFDTYWPGAADVEAADDVVLGPGEAVTGRDVVLEDGLHVAGTVTDTDENELADITVRLDLWHEPDPDSGSPGSWSSIRSTITGGAGHYDLGGLVAGRYRVLFQDNAGNYLDEYWDDSPTAEGAQAIDLADADPPAVADAALTTAAHISGTVTAADGGDPLQDIEVYVHPQDDPSATAAYASTDSDGHYSVGGLRAGTYVVEFRDQTDAGYLTQYFDRATTSAEATPVVLATGDVRGGVDATLATGATISGTVKNVGGDELNVYVTVIRPDGAGDWEYVDSDWTDALGQYSVNGLAPGSYRVTFADPYGIYAQQFFDGTSSFDDAETIEILGTESVGDVDATMLTYGTMSGRVTDGADPIDGVAVTLTRYYPDGDYWDYYNNTTTDAAGGYTFEGLTDGQYRLEFEDPDGDHLREWWQDAATAETATSIAAQAGQAVDLDDAVLDLAGRIAGTVSDDLTTLTGISVQVLRYDAADDDWETVAVTGTDVDGHYSLGGLAEGDYALRFSDPDNDVYLAEFWQDRTEVDAADLIHVTPGATATADPVLGKAGEVSGLVTGSDGEPRPDTAVYLYRLVGETWTQVNSMNTDEHGAYKFRNLTPGTYTLEFYDPTRDHLRQFWDGKSTLALADGFEVPAGDPVTGMDAQLSASGGIVGSVTDQVTDAPLAGVQVSAYQQGTGGSWDWVDSATTQADGTYDLRGLATGDYRIDFYDSSGSQHFYEAWPDAESVEGDAETFSVEAGAAPVTKDAQLTPSSHITGTVESEAGAGLESVLVVAYRHDPDDGWVTFRSEYTDSTGAYDIGQLRTGQYRLQFRDDSGDGYFGEFWDDADTVESADTIEIATAGQTAPPADAVLTQGGRITGTVTDPAGDGLGDVEVRVFTAAAGNDWDHVTNVRTDEDGHYTVPGLATGDHRLEFRDDSGNGYLTEYYDDSPTIVDADDVQVEVGATTPDIDAQLEEAAGVTGTLTGPFGAALESMQVSIYESVADGWEYVDSTVTEADGSYELTGLRPGTYRVEFADQVGNYLTEWWQDAAYVDEADDVVVDHGDTAEVDARLGPGAHLSGTVTGPDGQGLEDVYVTAARLNGGTSAWEDWNSTYTAADGSYDIGSLPGGSYRLTFDDQSGSDLDTEYWADVTEWDDATPILVEDEEQVGGRDARLTATIESENPPTIDGSAIVGETLTADPGEWSRNPTDFAYQWLADGEPIDGATSSTYHPVSGDVGKRLRIEVTASQDGYRDGVALSDPTDEVDLPELSNITAPSISGTAVVGSTLTADPGTWDPATGLTFAYQWLAGDDPITGATGSTYVPVAGDVTKGIRVTVTASRAGHHDAEETSAATAAVVLPTIVNVAAPTISGNPKAGSTLTAGPGTWDPATGLTFAYQWLAGNDPIAGATGSTYVPVAGDVGKAIRVRVTASRSGHLQDVETSAATAAVAPADIMVTTLPTVAAAKVGAPVTATPGTWTPVDVTIAYAWLVNGVPVAATGPTYTPVAGDVGKSLQVRITASKAGHADASSTSAAVKVAPGTIAATTKASIKGKAKRGGKITVKTGTWSPSGAKVTVQWYAGKKAIKKAKATKLKLTGKVAKAAAGKKISVRITVTAPGYTTVTTTLKAAGKVKK
jgi:5-hydroxyisourate hydrolase-like protein (transthyretin family)